MAKEQTPEEKAIGAAKAINVQADATQEAKAQQEQQLAAATEAKQIEAIVPVTATVASVDAATETALASATALPQSASGLDNLAARANAVQWRVDEHGRRNHPNDVKFQVSYSKTFKGDKTMEDGSIHVVSKETADHFVSLGIGNIVL